MLRDKEVCSTYYTIMAISFDTLSAFIFRIFMLFLFLILPFYYLRKLWQPLKKKSSEPINWPVLGMLPDLLSNVHRIHNFITDILEETGGTFEFKGPWFCDMNYVITSNPANIHHILSKNFSNYPKGTKFRTCFDILGNGIFNTDSEIWEIHRKFTLSVMNNSNFHTLLERTIWNKIENDLIPVLERGKTEIDLQDIFQRFTFDSISKLLLDYDPGSLSIDLPYVPCEKAFNDAMEAILHRHALPEIIWRLQKWLGIGKEKKLKRAWEEFDRFIYSALKLKQQKSESEPEEAFDDCVTAFTAAHKNNSAVLDGDLRVFLRDTVLNLMLAGRDTTSTGLTWLLWLLITNPEAKIKVTEEIESVIGNNRMLFTIEESRKLVYLHGAICEALRLFPPVALEHKSPLKSDVLPCGTRVDRDNTKLILSFFSMGRMESVWGKDCLEFKPERWITETGKVKHEPSYKFPAFNAGPRTCLGKEMAFVQMKMVAAAIVSKYDFELVESHAVDPNDSIIIQMKNGFPVKLSSRKK